MIIDIEDVITELSREVRTKSSIEKKCLITPYYLRCLDRIRSYIELVVLGAGVYGHRLYEMLEAEGIANKVCCICDNSIERRRFNSFPIDVLSVEEAVINYPDALYVITPRFYENELLQQLVDLGVPVKQIMIFTFAYTGLIDG